LLANFFARIKKLVVNCFLILNFNLVTLDFTNNKKLLKTTTTIFLKNFFILIGLLVATTTREIKEIINDKTKIEKNINYINILEALRLHAN